MLPYMHWFLGVLLNSHTGTAQLSPVCCSFHHPFITTALGKSKSTRGFAFGCLQRWDEWDAAFCVNIQWARKGRVGFVESNAAYSSCLKRGSSLTVRCILHSESWARSNNRAGAEVGGLGDQPTSLSVGTDWHFPAGFCETTLTSISWQSNP